MSLPPQIIIDTDGKAYHDEAPGTRDDDIRVWNSAKARMEWLSDGDATYCPGFRRERYGTTEEAS